MDNYTITDNKSKKGRPRLGINNTRLTDNKEWHRDYHAKYYRDNLSIKIPCPFCNRLISKAKLIRHQSTSICKKQDRKNTDSESDEWVSKIIGVYEDSDEFDNAICN